ncbi:MAG: alpha-(1-_3)-arabinofuranosyltransferase family protein [Corynebacterium sp.]|uniref:alpha-(1->3)-arabinofuranosyltransferase domain-containing protein n=1 Tax=Corynebacterium sp. TaxID=1720 RepID=UPI0026DAB026|nr:alpha-(1->3)-arabinofuranosyltransferase family protein [Corynebacterium sp.]MDO5097516.1 alpha-(1->3)-arabinofuranosyltransferase family protein [Corynebacterium sp.]
MAIHVIGWLLLGCLSVAQPFGKIAADTKHDLVANPGGFLAQASHAWTDVFPFGQLQNQAYGYLFPHGTFFWVLQSAPDWITQRLWWWLVLSVGYSGMVAVLRACGLTGVAVPVAAGMYCLSPRTLTTLTTISSETWPMMVAPWVLLPLLRSPLTSQAVCRSVVAVALMGAVNATATIAACVPAGLALLWQVVFYARPACRRRQLGLSLCWLCGCGLVSVWWIVPLLVLGAYASPFTDYIENATVVTNWLNIAEVLRGTTSWSPFVEAERQAGHLLATNPYLVIATMIMAGIGVYGLSRKFVGRGFWWVMLALGIVVLCGSTLVTGFLDGAGVAFRNVHKFDVLVRLPLTIGLAQVISRLALPQPRRVAAAVAVGLIAAAATAPAWSLRLLPLGAYDSVPGYWAEAAKYLNTHAAGTRTLILPASSFARQDWGWTRDEPAQALLEVPWAVRDAIPLVNPETIRGLDGMSMYPTEENLSRHGIGAVIIRHDLAHKHRLFSAERNFPNAISKQFGEVEVVIFNGQHDMYTVESSEIPSVAGGGESLALLGPGAFRLVAGDADIVTDSPLLLARNFGGHEAVSAPLSSRAENTDVFNRVIDYPSIGPLTTVVEEGGTVAVSSSAADPSSFTGPNPARSQTAAVDGDLSTAWYPRPGMQKGEWIELRTHSAKPVIEVTLTSTKAVRMEVTVTSGDSHSTVMVTPGTSTQIPVPGGATDAVRLTLGAAAVPVGVAEIALTDSPITRTVTVPDTSPDAHSFVFNRVFSNTQVLERAVTLHSQRDFVVALSACNHSVEIDGDTYRCGDVVTLAAGEHRIKTTARVVSLIDPQRSLDGAPPQWLSQRQVPKSDTERILVTNRAFNPGLKGTLDGVVVEPTIINAGIQAFIIPAGESGTFELSFPADRPYRLGLGIGGVIAIITVVVGALIGWRRQASGEMAATDRDEIPTTIALIAATIVAVGWPALIAVPLVWAVLRYTLFNRGILIAAAFGMAAMWLGRAPWPSPHYAGDALLLGLACVVGILAMCIPTTRRRRP